MAEPRVAVVTGGARGQGASHALHLARRGYVVHALDLREDDGRALEEAAAGEDLDVRFHRLDVTDAAGWSRFAAELAATHGRVHALVNNAGVVRVAGLEEEDLENFERVLRINVSSQFLGMSSLWALLKAAGDASVVNVASISASVASSGSLAYCASKSAVLGLTRAAALEGAAAGVRVNAISPGAVDTAMLAEESRMLAAVGRTFTPGGTPLGRSATSEEVSHLVHYLVSPESGFVTGSDFTIDGGFTAR